MVQLLLLEDDRSLVDGLIYSLKKNGFAVEVVRTVAEARTRLLEIGRFDLLILDVTLPDGTGFSASDEEVNIIRGLDCGGDDYLTKPFRLGELCSRIRALLRRAGRAAATQGQYLHSGALKIDLLGSRVTLDGHALELTAAEYRLLCLLVRNTGRVMTRESILRALWDDGGDFVDDNTLSVYVRRLREKVEDDPSQPRRLCTVRGFGYQWKEEGT